MNKIPEDLLEQVERGNVLLFVGEGVNQGILPSSQELATELAVRSDYPSSERLSLASASLARVAGYYEFTHGRHELVDFLRERLSIGTISPTHRLLRRLGVRVMVTTCVDQLLARALDEEKIAYTQVVGNSEIAYRDEQRLLLVNLWGVLDQPDSLIITEDDRRGFLGGRANLSDVLRGELAQRTWLFVGFDASDRWFRRFYDQVTHTLDRHRRPAYILGSQLDALARAWWQKYNAEIWPVESQPFLQQLVQEIDARRRPTRAIPLHPLRLSDEESLLPLPERPYKFLDYYEAQDAAIFYGRQKETQHLCALIHAHRLVVLYGASGVGKTSLLLAGAVPRLERATPPYKTIYIRALDDPSLVIRDTLRRQLPDADLPHDGSLVDFLAAVTKTLGQPLLIVLDQFEEFFIRLSPQFRAAFIAELGAVYDATDVPVKVLFSLREDWLASMDEVQGRIPDLSRSTRMRLLRLTRPQARQAITAPVERRNVSYEPELLERLLEELLGSRQKVMPPQLQLVCSALYDGRPEEQQVIRLATYERLGGVQGVLRKYLEEELSRLEPAEHTLARAVLEELVTSEKTKAVKSSTELALALEAQLDVLEPVLERLVQARLVRAVRETGQRAYELAHEYLIDEIRLAADTQARKEAEELLQQEIENRQRFATLLAADKLALINEVRDVLRLNDDAQALLLHSALQVGAEISYWLNRIPSPTRRVELLAQATQNKLTIVGQRAAETLGTQDVPQSVDPLLALALHDPNMDVRDTARQSLAQLTKQHTAIVERLTRSAAADETENTTSSTRAAALRTLTYLPISGLPFALRAQVLMMRVRLYVTSLIQASLVTPQRRAIAMTTGLLLLLVALAYAFSANAYYVHTASSPIAGKNVIVIRRGHPRLSLPGIDKILVDTGMNSDSIAKEDWQAANNKSRWGLSRQTGQDDYHKWGQDVADTLKPEHRAPMLWYLGQQEEAVQAILAATRSQDTQLQLSSLFLLKQIVTVAPQLVEANSQLAEQVLQALLPLLEHEEWQARNSAASTLAQTAEADPQLAQQVIAALLPLLSDEHRSVRRNAASAVGQVAKANPAVAKQVLQALRPLLSDEEWYVRDRAASAVGQVREPQLAEQVLQALRLLLSDEHRDVRASAASALGQVREPQLAQQVIAALLPLLSDEESRVRGNAGSAVRQVVQANPAVAEQVVAALLPLLSHERSDVRLSAGFAVALVREPQLAEQAIAALLPLLSDEESDVRGDAASAVGRVLEGNSQLVTEQVVAALLPLLSDEENYVRERAAFAVGQVREPQLVTKQLLAALLPLLSDEYSGVRGNAVSAVAQVAEANPQLAEQVLAALLSLLSDKNRDVRASAASAVGQLLEGDSQLVTEQVIAALLPLLSHEDSDVRVRAASAVRQVREPQLAEQVLQALLPLLSDENSEVRHPATSAVGRAYAHQKDEAFLFDTLTASQNALQRPVAARALFLIALQDPTRGQGIHGHLEELAKSPEPIERIWANKTLAMLEVAPQAHEAAKLDGEPLEEAARRLQKLCEWDYRRRRCATTGSSHHETPYIFGEDFAWAVGEALNWLDEQTNEQQAQ
ncbi:MAG: sister chromatid cohesion protein PDS5 [Ardenticatenaceae bacterium]